MVAAVLACACLAHAQNAGHISAQVTRASVAHGAGTRASRTPAANGTPVEWGDTVQTDASGRARIVLNDQSILTLGQRSQLTVVKHDADSQQTALQLAYGRIRCRVSQLTRTNASFRLTTPTAVAGVIGTDFGADASIPGQTKFICIAGTTRIYSPDMKTYVDCGPGKTVTVGRGQTPSKVAEADTPTIERWQHITEPGDPQYAEAVNAPPAAPFPPTRWHGLTISGNWRFRGEGWNWFQDGSADNSYAFAQSILRIGIGQQRDRVDWLIELAQPSLLGLPQNAIAAAPQGQLGLGGTYFSSNGASRNAAFVFPDKAFLRFKRLGGSDTSLTIGRFDFVDGAEMKPADATLAALKPMRIAHRLIGNFQFTVTGRSEDGLWLSSNFRRANLTLAAARPTRGVYQVDGLGELDVSWQYGALTVATGHDKSNGELRIFGLGYQDNRALAKTDNRPATLRNGADRFANINLGTFGAHYIHAVATSAGTFDFLLWGAGQIGSWGTQNHRAGAFDGELGWQPHAALRPWLRAGYSYGSGDNNPNDNQHGTFFQVLPTPRIYARFPFFDMQNNSDAFAMLLLRPSPKLTLRSDVHALWLSSRNDLWYQGGGASAPRVFGYQGRPSNGNRGLGTLWDISADAQLTPHWGLGLYYGHVWGKGVMKSIYPAGPDANLGYAELLFRF